MSDLSCLALNGVVTQMKTKMRTPMELVSQPPIISRGGRTTGKKRQQPSHHQPQMEKSRLSHHPKSLPPIVHPMLPSVHSEYIVRKPQHPFASNLLSSTSSLPSFILFSAPPQAISPKDSFLSSPSLPSSPPQLCHTQPCTLPILPSVP